ncbi:hypothetical protein [Photorhabdus sp. RW14-46]|uniref:hypothetical protein n=1 Tax=Photorhabdus sp. RW14-46 TaxID=2100168 RepID=UPI0013F3F5A6|nr:hypothetical protein [Photorhabdus sp. RW14-46]
MKYSYPSTLAFLDDSGKSYNSFLQFIRQNILSYYTQWISRCIAAARERIPGSIDNYVTGVSECSQQRSNLKDDGYILTIRNCYIM